MEKGKRRVQIEKVSKGVGFVGVENSRAYKVAVSSSLSTNRKPRVQAFVSVDFGCPWPRTCLFVCL